MRTNLALKLLALALVVGLWGLLGSAPTDAQISTGSVNAKQSGTWNVTVNTALPTGTNTIGKVDAGAGPATAWKVDLSTTGANATAINISAASLPALNGTGTFLSNQQAVTASAVALATNSVKGVCVKALTANTINVYIGPSGVTTSNGDELAPGDGRCYPLNNTNLIFVIASTTGASVSWSAWN